MLELKHSPMHCLNIFEGIFKHFKTFSNLFQFYRINNNKTIKSKPFCRYNFLVFWNRPFLDKLFVLIHLMTF